MSGAEKVVLITGGAGGVGRESALLLAASGARVVVADLRQQPSPPGIESMALDVTSEGARDLAYPMAHWRSARSCWNATMSPVV